MMRRAVVLLVSAFLYTNGHAVSVEDGGSGTKAVAAVQVVINEVVTDPQQDWNDSSGGNGVPFDNTPGSGTIGSTDEWIELYNAGGATVDLSAWVIEMVDTTPETLQFSDPGSAVLVFSNGGSVSNFQPGEYLVVGNPPGAINNDVYIVLKDGSGTVVDDVELGDDPEEDGTGDGAPDGGSGGGNASGTEDEAIARVPNGADTDDDIADFTQQAATIGAANDGGGEELIPDIAVVPVSHDFGDVEIGSSASQRFVVKNEGTADLEVQATTLVGDDADQFSVDTGAGPFTVAPGDSHDVVVSFSPTSEGTKNATLRFESNDPDESPLDVTLQGTGVPAGIRVKLPEDARAEPGSLIEIPIRVSDLTNKEVLGYAAVIRFDETVLRARGASRIGTLSEDLDRFRVVTRVPGAVGVGGYRSTPLSGSGILVNLLFKVVGEPGNVTELTFVKFMLNTGDPEATTEDGLLTVIEPEDAGSSAARKAISLRSEGRTKGERSPTDYVLLQNFPNPFNPETTIRFGLPEPVHARLLVYDVGGRLVRTLVQKTLPAGMHRVIWDGRDLDGRRVTSGVYFYRLEAGAFVQVKRMVLLE
jgi:hypothetical protein